MKRIVYLLPENNTQQHIYLEMRDYKDKTREELLEIIRNLEEQLESRSFPDSPCQNEESDRFRKQYGREILEAIPDMLTVFDYNLDYIELLSSPDTNHVEGLSGEDKSHPNLKDIVPESEYRKIRANMEKVVRTGCPSIGEHSLQFEGETHHYENLVCPLGDKYLLCMCRDVTSRVNAQRELAAARVKAEESDRLKSAFLANMSHEIRTPLNAINGFSNLLLDETIDAECKVEFPELIQQNTDLLTRLLNDLLEVSNLSSSVEELPMEKADICSICVQEMDRLQTGEGKVSIHYCLDVDNGDCNIRTNIPYLSQTLAHLLNNANKFTESGEIKLSCHREGEQLVIKVTDTGIGIPEEKQEWVFDRFTKLDEFKPGAGLGLYICRLIVRRLGGTINIDREYTGGTRFVLVFPVKN